MASQFSELIDSKLMQVGTRSLVSSNEVRDWLLDLRNAADKDAATIALMGTTESPKAVETVASTEQAREEILRLPLPSELYKTS